MQGSFRGVGKRFLPATLESVSPEHFAEVYEYAANYQTYLRAGRGLLLSGNPGIGKTWAMIALMSRLYTLMGASASRWDYHVITAPLLFAHYAPDSNTPEQDEFRNQSWNQTFETVQGLVINDLGKEDRSRDWLREAVTYKLGRLLRARHEAQLPIFLTTNLALKAGGPDGTDVFAPSLDMTVVGVYGSSIWSLLYDLTAFRVQTTGPDRRSHTSGTTL